MLLRNFSLFFFILLPCIVYAMDEMHEVAESSGTLASIIKGISQETTASAQIVSEDIFSVTRNSNPHYLSYIGHCATGKLVATKTSAGIIVCTFIPSKNEMESYFMQGSYFVLLERMYNKRSPIPLKKTQ